MKIAVSTQGDTPESPVDERFGRAKGFLIFDDETNSFTYEDNAQNLSAMQGAGIQSAKRIIDSGATVLITGNVGPKAFATLNSASIEIFCGAAGTVRDAITKYKEGGLSRASNANVEGHW
ncbi:MAG TPA: NifB/NifX family molybdenum-iron cluster-binding protein [Spirochaetota bacterium]|nr:NifB/NifX family molybdenum-iron cluster-binding protein [Spirochaetota bacterium]HPJ40007.1 NifB/NifX family molybdenum-iron cluster-binding protein [Spirochaetota bacterium]HPQ53944.1 NifB/NifX family molybdenum-iron cluster-binding protein [Spirochaetota bacterium]